MHCRNGFSTFRDVDSWIAQRGSRHGSKEAPLIFLDSKSAMCMTKNGKDNKHTRNIARIMHFLWNGEKCKMHKIDWCQGGMNLADIATKNFGEHDLTPVMKYIMVRLEN